MAAAVILNFEKRLSILYYSTNPNQIWWTYGNSDVECICSVGKSLVTKYQDGGILNSEKLLSIHYYLTKHRQTQWDLCDCDVERICHVENRTVTNVQDGGCHCPIFEKKTAAVYSLFNQFSPNWVSMLCIRLRTHMWCREIALDP